MPAVRKSQYKRNPTNLKIYGPKGQIESFGMQDYFYMIFETTEPCTIELKCTFTLKMSDLDKQNKKLERVNMFKKLKNSIQFQVEATRANDFFEHRIKEGAKY